MIDIKDTMHKQTTRNGKIVKNKLYRHSCDKCGSDRGYQAKSFKTASCNKCAKIGISLSKETKEKMSIAAKKRYTDPTWKPNVKNKSFSGQRRHTYISKIDKNQKRLRHNMKSLLWQKIKNHNCDKKDSTFNILNYSLKDLIDHLQSSFKPGMSWDNYGSHWHVDHIIPDSWFTYSNTNDQDFFKSWSLSNLQPMWAEQNISKGNRYSGDFKNA